MADSVNRVWVSMDLGNFNIGKKTSLFVGADTPDELLTKLEQLFGQAAAHNIIGHFSELTTEDAFDNLKAGGLVGDNAPASSPSTKSDGPVCHHGPKQYKTGVKNGKQWAAWMCPAPKGTAGQCPPEWA